MKPEGTGGGVEKRRCIPKEHSHQWGREDWEREERGRADVKLMEGGKVSWGVEEGRERERVWVEVGVGVGLSLI